MAQPIKWDYPYWNKKFREATDLDAVHEEFYKAAGIHVHSVNLKTGEAPSLLPHKDYVLRDLIVKTRTSGTMLVIAFWLAHFPLHMGLTYDFTVDGVECYLKAVNSARVTQSTLPPELAKKFSFNHGVAEDLSGYQLYDVIVCFCLEHVRNPKRIVDEALKHLKPDGALYFTPPIGHGTDSPTHLHHFEEADLRALFPPEYTVNIYRTRFLKDSPRDNCFIVEAQKQSGT